jgi:hypothetical protein
LQSAAAAFERVPGWRRCTERNVRFGSKADIRTAKTDVRFPPESDIKCDIWNVR